MPTQAQLDAKSQELRKAISDITESDRPGSEKATALESIRKDFTEHRAEIEAFKASEEMTKALGDGGASKDSFDPAEDESFTAPNIGQARDTIARNLMRHPIMKGVLAKAKDKLPYEGDRTFMVDTERKDATAGANIMGDNFAGANSISYAGQNPFLNGPWGPAMMPNWLPGIVEQRFYQLRVADLIPSISTDAPNLSYLVEQTEVMNASATAENALYPFSSNSFSRVYEQVGKIANAGVLTDELIQDAPALYNFFLNRLVEGIQRQEEIQLLAGSGLPGVNGLLSRSAGFQKPQTITAVTNVKIPANGTVGVGAGQSTIASLTYGRKITGTGTTGTAPTAVQIAEGIFAGFNDIQLGVQYQPNAIVMHPLDWATVRLGKDSAGQYYGGSFFGTNYGQGQGHDNLWGVPVVQTVAIPQGTILTGYFDGSTIQAARRKGIVLQTTNSNVDDFVNGRITVRAEERLGLMVYRPAAFELITLAPAA